MVEDYFAFYVDENRRRSGRMDLDRRRSGSRVATDGFRCVHCGAFVTREALFSGVINRNHCPYCLWSRHVDWKKAGDRMSACKGGMRPVGLALKRAHKKYNPDAGELMVVHRCNECGQVSLNRIAADDAAETLLVVYQESLAGTLRDAGVELLTAEARDIVHRRLFGAGQPQNLPAC